MTTARRPGRRWLATALAAHVVGAAIGLGLTTASAAGLTLRSTALTPVRTCLLSATPTTTSVVIDTEVRQSTAATNYGTATALTVTSSGTANRRAYVRFDLASCVPAIPVGAVVDQATLRLFITALPAVCRTIDIFAVPSTWAEGALTWSNQPFGTGINAPATATRTDSFDAGTPAGCQNRTTNTYLIGADVTTDVARFVAGAAANHGWMIRDDVEGSATARTVTFAAKNLGTLARVPQLVVTYTLVP